MFSAVGLKSRQSLKSNTPDGLGSSGSIFCNSCMLVCHHNSFGPVRHHMNQH